jgi:chitinase
MAQMTFKRIAFLVAVAFSALLVADATQVMHRPENYKNLKINKVETSKNFTVHHLERRATGKVSAAYFTNW